MRTSPVPEDSLKADADIDKDVFAFTIKNPLVTVEQLSFEKKF